MTDDSVADTIPITHAPDCGVPDEPGIGVEIDEAKLSKYQELYRKQGQFPPRTIRPCWIPTYIDESVALTGTSATI